jgi:hypothetical protein
MPVRVTFSHTERLATVVAEGDIFPDDIQRHLELVDRDNTRAYATLLDLRRMRSRISPRLGILTELIAERAQESEVGPIAIVIGDNKPFEEAARRFATAGIRCPIKVFTDEPSAHAWLDAQRSDKR